MQSDSPDQPRTHPYHNSAPKCYLFRYHVLLSTPLVVAGPRKLQFRPGYTSALESGPRDKL